MLRLMVSGPTSSLALSLSHFPISLSLFHPASIRLSSSIVRHREGDKAFSTLHPLNTLGFIMSAEDNDVEVRSLNAEDIRRKSARMEELRLKEIIVDSDGPTVTRARPGYLK